jgi:6-phosphogluconate dehydrogenase
MGGNMARRLLQAGHQVVGYNLTFEPTQQMAVESSLIPSKTLTEAVSLLTVRTEAAAQPRKIVWIMVPAGEATEHTIQTLSELLSPGDVIVDGGNSFFKDTLRRSSVLAQKGLFLVDAGVSGGIWGLVEGYALMIGGDRQVVEFLGPIFASLAPAADKGWGYVGPSGSGHYVKMVHNGIEYGLMEAYAEGFELLRARPEFGLDLHQVAEIWRHGSVIRSWLLELTSEALAEDADLDRIKSWVDDSGEGRWTVSEAIEMAVPIPAIAIALFRRFESRQEEGYAGKLLAAIRNRFGGHAFKTGQNGTF